MKSATILVGSDFGPEVDTDTHEWTVQVTTKGALSTSLQNFDNSTTLEFIHLIVSTPALFDPLSLAGLVPRLRPHGTLSVQVCSSSSLAPTTIHTAFLLAGLTAQSERRDRDGARVFTATKSSGGSGGSGGSINSNSIKLRTGAASIRLPVRKPLTIALDDLDLDDDDEDEDGWIDEDGLLDIGLLAPPPKIDVEQRQKELADDCSGGRKACDNCTCGRAQAEASQPMPPTTSACGNCSKGDAFRCAGCPHLGKPSFKEGEEHLVLDLMDDL